MLQKVAKMATKQKTTTKKTDKHTSKTFKIKNLG